ncbi:Gibberellin-regulated protein 6 [Cocos nucifera]|uniref:Gibberellin-regulated protein 6 n=1 Tax=Cocos nucifera TaxID=13894 RepID=A0A8K0IY19_COCNU|nr:Gibberellin-regulated protein 6 [Cocos nucifera]
MASKMRIVVLSILFMLLLSTEGQANHHSPGPAAQPAHPPSPTPQPIKSPLYGTTQGSLQPQECPGRCASRCSKTAYKKPCMFFCQKCCSKCLCVPPGTYGNKEFCPCYDNWKTKRGGPKCP